MRRPGSARAAGVRGRQVYRPLPGRVLALGYVLFAGAWALALLTGAVGSHARVLAPLLAASAVLVHAMFWRAAVVVDDDAVALRNVWRDVRVPWAALRGVGSRYALTLVTDRGTHQSIAATGSGRSRAGHPGDAGLAAVLVEQRWQAWRARPRAVRDDGEPEVVVRWNAATIVPTVVLLAAALVGRLA